ncbi:hypothetical protein ACLB2K_038002 [Fragaria x ananassa]
MWFEETRSISLMEAQEFGEMMEHVDERRLLRTQGMTKTITEAILDLSLDDTPSDLAAATIFYVLTCDGQDDPLLESPSCINFLIRFCKPIVTNITEDKAPKIGRKLLALRLSADISHCAPKIIDSNSAAILSKVHKILVTCKEMKPSSTDDGEMSMPELSPKWIALLTMEKACLSTISLEETTGTVRQAGGNFKEKLRELGGLDAVFEVSMSCHSEMEGWLKGNSPSTWEKETNMVRNLVLLFKCLKVMENATFLIRNPFAFSFGSGEDAGLSQKSYISKNSKINLLGENQDPFAFTYGSSEDAALSQRSYISEDSKVDLSQEGQDPFAFDEDDIEPSQWDILSGKKKISSVPLSTSWIL